MCILCPTPPILCLQKPVDHLCHQFYWVWIKFLAPYNRFVPNDFLMEISYLFMRKVQHVGIVCVFKVILNVLINKLSNIILLWSRDLPLKAFELFPCKILFLIKKLEGFFAMFQYQLTSSLGWLKASINFSTCQNWTYCKLNKLHHCSSIYNFSWHGNESAVASWLHTLWFMSWDDAHVIFLQQQIKFNVI